MPRVKSIPVDTIVQPRLLQQSPMRFWCPFCEKTWLRGGHKEGFVKSAANNHVAACWEILVFQAGYVIGPYVRNERTALPIAQAQTRVVRAIKALIASRRRNHLEPRIRR